MISFVMSLILFGGFYEWNVTVIGICILLEILFFYQKKKPVYHRKRNFVMWIPGILFVWMLVVSFWALDTSEHILGIVRGIVLLVWIYRCFLMEEEEKQKIYSMIPYLGAMMTGVGIISLVEEYIASYFWQARRFGGCFQYPNTCALFLMIGLILQIEKLLQWKKIGILKIAQKNDKSYAFIRMKFCIYVEVVVLLLLVTGLFFTGCRSVLLLFFGWGIYKGIRIKEVRVPFFVTTIATMIIAYTYGMVIGDQQNIARIFTIFQSNSTIWGRILYAVDALSMSVKYPFGLGYMGYFYMQPVMQKGVYTSRFVHNDFLQVLVDYGLVAFMLVMVYFGYQLFKGKQSVQKKEILLLLMIASLMDFHLQYMTLQMLLVLCCDLGERKGVKKRSELRENYVFLGLGIVAGIYFTMTFGANYFGKYDLAIKLFPSYTSAQIKALQESTEKEEAVKIADEIISHNEYVSEAYNTKVYASVMEGDFLKAVEWMEHVLTLRRYDTESYRYYDDLFDEMIKICDNENMVEEREILKQKRDELPEKLASLEKETHPLAFRLRDVPEFMW